MIYNNHNVRKKQILIFLNYSPPQTAREITDFCPVSLSCVCALLKRYTQQGLIKRVKENNKFIKPFLYEITEKGEERLDFLIGNKSEKEKIDLFIEESIKIDIIGR